MILSVGRVRVGEHYEAERVAAGRLRRSFAGILSFVVCCALRLQQAENILEGPAAPPNLPAMH